MTIDEAIDVLKELEEHTLHARICKALNIGIEALTAMRDINKAEDMNEVVEILHDYMNEVEV